MAITSVDQLLSALGNNSSLLTIAKASITSQAAGNYVSLWRATGLPGQGAIPAAAAVCNNTLVGGINFTQQTSPATSYLAQLEASCANATTTLEIHDRLVHRGGLNGTLNTAQTVGIDFNGLTTDNMVERIGAANYSDIQWWLEWYAATGATAVTATLAATYNDGTSANIAVSLAATRPAGLMIPINGLIPAAQAGKYIRAINTLTNSATTGAAGNFGITATRLRGSLMTPVPNAKFAADWAALGMPEIRNSSCLFPLVQTTTTSSGIVRGTGKIAHG